MSSILNKNIFIININAALEKPEFFFLNSTFLSSENKNAGAHEETDTITLGVHLTTAFSQGAE